MCIMCLLEKHALYRLVGMISSAMAWVTKRKIEVKRPGTEKNDWGKKMSEKEVIELKRAMEKREG